MPNDLSDILLWRRRRRALASPSIRLSSTSIGEDAEVGDTVGTLSVRHGSGEYTFSITSDPDSKFAIDGNLLKLADTLDYETATSHSVTIEADNGVDDPLSRTPTIRVTNVIEAVAVLILAGQSNSRTLGTTAAEVPEYFETPDDGVLIWSVSDQEWQTYQPGVNSDPILGGECWGAEAEFSRLYRSANPGRPLRIIKYAVNGSYLAQHGGGADWSPSSNAEHFGDAKAQIAAALAALDVPYLVAGVAWVQGENDAWDTEAYANAYQTNLAQWAAAVRTEWQGCATCPIIIARISQSTEWVYRASVRAAQLAVADADPSIHIISADTYDISGDNQHYGPASVVQLGADLYAAYRGTYAAAPTDIAVTWRGGYDDGLIPENTDIGTVIADLSASNAVVGGGVSFSVVADPDGKVDISGATLVLDGALTENDTHEFTLRVTNNLGRTYDKAFGIEVTEAVASTPTTWNPADKSSAITLSNGNLSAVIGSSVYANVRSVAVIGSGNKVYFECVVDLLTFNPCFGVANSAQGLTGPLGNNDTSAVIFANGGYSTYPSSQDHGSTATAAYTTGDVISVAYDDLSGLIWFRKNGGDWNNSGSADPEAGVGGFVMPVSGDVYAVAGGGDSNEAWTAAFAPDGWIYSAPSGFGAIVETGGG